MTQMGADKEEYTKAEMSPSYCAEGLALVADREACIFV